MTTPPKRNWRRLQWNCFIEYADKEGVSRQGKGRRMVLEGALLELFPTGVLCAMLHRNRKTLYKWEKDFGFPQAMWRIRDDTNTNRWYSRKQLIAIRTIYGRFNCLKGENRKDLRLFIAAVRALFFTIDQPAEITSNDHQGHGTAADVRDGSSA